MLLPLERLVSHPDAPRRMPPATFAKLKRLIRDVGRCPALIVRPHPRRPGDYEIIDGRHRARALAELGERSAPCEIWRVDDRIAAILLLTLNRLRGADDPVKRGALLAPLRETMDEKSLLALLPESKSRLQRLVELTRGPRLATPLPGRTTAGGSDQPTPVTIFLTPAQRDRLLSRLRGVAPTRGEALARLLDLDADPPAEPRLARCDCAPSSPHTTPIGDPS